jgi:hypothetical protein
MLEPINDRMKTYKILLLSLICFNFSCKKNTSEHIPFIEKSDIIIDGFFLNEEWSDAKIIDISKNNTLYLLQNEDYVFIGIKNDEIIKRYIDLYLVNETYTINLHASMQLGERILIDSWDDSTPKWHWGNNMGW